MTMTTPFDFGMDYVLGNEGGESDHPDDRGGQTKWGITRTVCEEEGFAFDTLILPQARAIYRGRFWRFDGMRDRRLAAKCFDVVVNFGMSGGMRLLQKACGAVQDGIYGPETEGKLTNAPTDEMLSRITSVVADRYIDIVRDRPTQLVFLKGWIRRAIRQPERRIPEPHVGA